MIFSSYWLGFGLRFELAATGWVKARVCDSVKLGFRVKLAFRVSSGDQVRFGLGSELGVFILLPLPG